MLQKSLRDHEIDTELLPLHKITPELVSKTKKVLESAKELLDDEREERRTATLDNQQACAEQIAELSNTFYELIPHKDFSHEKITSLDQQTVNQKLEMLESLHGM